MGLTQRDEETVDHRWAVEHDGSGGEVYGP